MMGLLNYNPEEWCRHEFTKSQEIPTGCWYCDGEDVPVEFSHEWDTPVHLCCIKRARAEDPKDKEAEVFAKEFNLD